MRVGFTGTREGMNQHQKDIVTFLLREFRADIFEAVFLHGNCVGADEEALEIATELGYRTVAHPIDMPDLQISLEHSHDILPVEKPLKRNRNIVKASDVMIATPKETEKPKSTRGSGTWYTIDYATTGNLNRRNCYIVWPDRSYELVERSRA